MEGNIYQIIWFVLWAVLWTGYFVLDGFDLGAGSAFYLLGKKEEEKKAIYQALGPFWDGNEVWLITAGGATFAAFPKTYAVMFSSLYSALLLLLFSLILRGVSIEYRNKYDKPLWKTLWDLGFFLGSILPPFLLGVAFANIFQGIPIDEKGIYHGSLFTLLNPFGILGGILFVFCFAAHGCNWIAFKTNGELSERAATLSKKFTAITLVLAGLFFFGAYLSTNLWENYFKCPLLLIIPLISVIGFLMVFPFLIRKNFLGAFLASAVGILGFSAWGFVGLFPNMLPSSLNPAWNLTIYNSSSSLLTLQIMTIVALIFVPIVLAYTFWAYKTFSFKISSKKI
ncbi:cytochrome d ubiquinol oxidase subunit II [Thermodesulfobacterium commune]|uniref:cytochrome d ubiquinol oxidase subunit II n=1 Tax=Thermodesulfobacterium commune TaxID=1741 RepID=UPI002FDB89BB